MDELRALIINGELAAGSAIRQEELAERFAVSRMPVRQALDVLASEGWVEQRPHRGAVVMPLNAEDAVELFQIRAALEVLAMERSFPLLTDAQLETIQKAGEALIAADSDQPVMHQSFHLALYAAAGPRLLRLIIRELDAAQRYLQFESGALAVSDVDRSEHLALIEAACARDVTRGVAILKSHILGGAEGIYRTLKQREADASG